VAVVTLAATPARATLLGPSEYLNFDTSVPGHGGKISPFFGLSFSYFHLENFEDHLFNVPGVSASAGGVTSVVFGPLLHDSVDADDGVIDGSGLLGDSFFSGSGATGISFTFNAGVLGALPTHAGIVWTDGSGTVTFRAFGPGNVLLGTIGPVSDPPNFPNASVNGETAEDRFFGVIDPGGIERIFISNSLGGIEVDHLQYGVLQHGVIPEPGTVTLILIGLTVAGVACWRKKKVAE
jgi:hypothetical protein